MSAAEVLPDRAALVAAVAKELGQARPRGLDALDLSPGNQHPIATPELERLARRYTGDEASARVKVIRCLLTDAFTAWEAEGQTTQADFVHGLFFAGNGGAPGPDATPQALLDTVKARSQLSDDTFVKRRQAAFRLFAAFLIKFVDESAAHEVPAPRAAAEPRQPRGLTRVLAGLVGLAVISGGALLGLRGDTSEGRTTTDPPATAVTFRFDALGGGSPYIRVFPGVGNAPADLIHNGTFMDGQTAPAVCQTKGRLVTSDPSLGERPRESDIWIRIIGTPSLVQYARLTYGYLSKKDLAALPPC